MSISFSGLASGLDTSSWVQSLTALKRAKITTLQQEKTEAANVQDAIANIKSFFTSFRSTLEKVTDSKLFSGTSMDVFTKKLAASTNTDVVTATATSAAKEATYNIEVDKLATATEAVSKYTANYEKIKTANLDSKLTSLGVDIANEGSQIKVNKNGVESTITLNNSDTIATFLNKLKNVGVEGSFNEKNGSISLNVGKNDITDVSGTGIKTALHLENVNSGYESAALTTTKVENMVQAADRDTRMSDLGITNFAGKTFGANFEGGYHELSFEDAEDNTKSITLGNLIDFINANGGSASIDENGVFEVSGLALSNDFSIDVFDALGLSPTVTETSQTSKALKLTVEDTVGEAITGETSLGQIFDFGEDESRTVVVNGTTEKTFTSGMTVDDFLDELEDAGLTTSLALDGTITLSGGEITGGTLNLSPLELTETPNSASVTSSVLTEEVTTDHIAALNTKLSDLGITQGGIKIKDGENYVYDEDITSPNRTLLQFLNDLSVYAESNVGAMSYTSEHYTDPNSGSKIHFNTETGQITFDDADLISTNITAAEIEDFGLEDFTTSNVMEVLFGANIEDNKNVTSSSLTSEKLYYTEVGSEAATVDTLLSKYYSLGNGEDFAFKIYTRTGELVLWDESDGATHEITMSSDATIGDLISTINEKNLFYSGQSANANFQNGRITMDGYITANGDFVENTGMTTNISRVTYGAVDLVDSAHNMTHPVSGIVNLSSVIGINPNNDFMSGLQRITDADQISAEGWTTVSSAQDFADAITGGSDKILLTGDIDFNGFNDYNTAASDLIINGNGYTISNLTKGLFSTLEDSEVYNLKLTGTMSATDSTGDGFLADVATGTVNVHNVTVNGTINTSNNSEVAGLVFGKVNNGATLTLDGISVSGRVGSTQVNVEDHTEVSGGMIGSITADCSTNITDVYSNVEVNGDISGGIIGTMDFQKACQTHQKVNIQDVMSSYTNFEGNTVSAFVGAFKIIGDVDDLSAFNSWQMGSQQGKFANNYIDADSAGTAIINCNVSGIMQQWNCDEAQYRQTPSAVDNKGFIIKDSNDDVVAAIDTSGCTTLSNLLGTLDSYGFEYSITDGVINISNETNNYYLADTSLTQSLGLTTDPVGATSVSSRLTFKVDTSIYHPENLLGELGITAGTLNVITDEGTTQIAINTTDTIGDLRQALSDAGLNTDASMTANIMITCAKEYTLTSNDSNILDVLNMERTTYVVTSSDELYYPTYTPTEISGTTKLVDITGFGNSEVSDFTLETGYYHIFTPDGVQHTEEITDTTTVNEFLATLRGYGFDATISAQGKITVESTGNAYIAESNYVDNNSNIADLLNLTQNRNIVSDSLGYSTTNDENITRATKLSNISDTYQDGYITVVNSDGTRTNVNLDVNETVGSFIDKLSDRGFDIALTDGVITIASEGTRVVDYTGMGQASNALNILGISPSEWEIDNSYVSKAMHVIDPENPTYEVAADRNTALSDLGVTTGEYNIYNNGVKYTAYISSDETLGSFVDTLKSFGLSVGVFNEGDQTIVKLTGNGNSYLETSASANASNVVSTLFNSPEAKNAYAGNLETEREEITNPLADADTLVGELAGAWGESVAGNVVVNVNDVESSINISNEDSIGAVLERFRQLGIDAAIADGKITMQGGFNTFSIDSSKSTSSLANPSAATGLIRNEDMDGYVSSSETILATTQETKDVSVANWADLDTKLGLMNITSGSLSVYKDGAKGVVHVDSSQTFAELKDAINAEFGGSDIELSFDEGLLKIYSLSGANVEVGSGIDTSNFSSITGMQKGEDGIATSVRELYKVNSSSLVTHSGIFRRGDVFAGDFIIGDTTFTIDDTTTIGGLVNMINNSSEANANAYWDNVTGNFVITSKATGASYINIETDTSNFADIMGYTASEWNEVRDGEDNVISRTLESTRMLAENQNLGQNAKFKINGTSYTSTTNTISSDVSRIEGVTLNLKGLSKGESAQVTISKDKEKVADTMEEVVNAYNELMENVDKEIAASGTLSGESTLKMIRNQLRTLMTGSESGMTKFMNLDSIGIGVSKAAAGNVSTVNSSVINLAFDRDKFTSAYEDDASELKKLLLGTEEDSSSGIFNRVESVLNNALKSVTGYFDIAAKTQTNKISNLNDKITRQNQYVERYKQQLEKKFKTMDMLISQMNERYSSLLNGGF